MHALAHKLGKNMLVVPADMDLAGFYGHSYDDSALPASSPEQIYRSPLSRHISVVEPRLYGYARVQGTEVVLVGEQTWVNGQPQGPADHANATVGVAAAAALGVAVPAKLQVSGVDLAITSVAEPAPGGIDRGVFASLGAAQRALARSGDINAMRLAGCWCKVGRSPSGGNGGRPGVACREGTVSSRSVLHRHERGFAVFVRTDEAPAARHRVGQRRGRLPAGGVGSRRRPAAAAGTRPRLHGDRGPVADGELGQTLVHRFTYAITSSWLRSPSSWSLQRWSVASSSRHSSPSEPAICPRLSGPAAAAGVMGDCGYGWRYCYISDRAGGHGHGVPARLFVARRGTAVVGALPRH